MSVTSTDLSLIGLYLLIIIIFFFNIDRSGMWLENSLTVWKQL